MRPFLSTLWGFLVRTSSPSSLVISPRRAIYTGRLTGFTREALRTYEEGSLSAGRGSCGAKG